MRKQGSQAHSLDLFELLYGLDVFDVIRVKDRKLHEYETLLDRHKPVLFKHFRPCLRHKTVFGRHPEFYIDSTLVQCVLQHLKGGTDRFRGVPEFVCDVRSARDTLKAPFMHRRSQFNCIFKVGGSVIKTGEDVAMEIDLHDYQMNLRSS